MRGKEYSRGISTVRYRITPAYAGKRLVKLLLISQIADHPCVCGEKFKLHLCVKMIPGSPLRMRGKVLKVYNPNRLLRITPAYAGKRCHLQKCRSRVQDHPCVCGEKEYYKFITVNIIGSPLRMRGKANTNL